MDPERIFGGTVAFFNDILRMFLVFYFIFYNTRIFLNIGVFFHFYYNLQRILWFIFVYIFYKTLRRLLFFGGGGIFNSILRMFWICF